jgi:HEAT repeats
MRTWLRDLGAATTAQESALLLLVVVIGALLVATVIFSAYAIVLRARHQRRDRRREMLAQRWREAVLHAVADPDAVDAVHALVGDHQLSFIGFVLEFARRVRGAEKESLRRLVAPYLGLIEERALARRVEVRARAIQTLGTLGLPDHAPTVIAALDDPSPLVAMIGARALAREKSPEYAQ